MALRMVVGLALTVVAVAGRRLWWLKRLALSGQPAPERIEAVPGHPGRDVATETTKVLGQRKLPGCGRVRAGHDRGLLLEGPAGQGTCTECGRCQSQCPAWATGKPLSPKQVILDLRDHAFAKAPWLLASSDEKRDRLPDAVRAEAGRPLVGSAGRARGDAVVVHQLRGVRRGMPGGHRAHRPHRRDAAAPGADRVRVPGRGGTSRSVGARRH
jgi:ferredoxin